MKIKEFSITRYGPLPNSGKIELNGFNIFFGRNEEGKKSRHSNQNAGWYIYLFIGSDNFETQFDD